MSMIRWFDSDKPFYKGNLHTHTQDSDGKISYDDILKAYQEKGYDFLAVTDHWIIHPQSWYKNMLVLPGVEMDFLNGNLRTHIVGIVDDMEIAAHLSRDNTPQESIDYVNAKGGAAIVAHPAWSIMTPEELLSYRDYVATEIYNGITYFRPYGNPRNDSSVIVDMAARKGVYLPLIASDDTHFPEEMFTGYIMLQASELSMPAILESLRAGKFYASQGPEFLSIDYDENEIRIRTSPVKYICAYSDCPLLGREGRFVEGENITEYTYRYRPHMGETGVRIEIMDDQGRRAWSSYIKFPEK